MQTGRAMARALNVVQTSHTFVDYMILSKAADSGQVYLLLANYANFITLHKFLKKNLYLCANLQRSVILNLQIE